MLLTPKTSQLIIRLSVSRRRSPSPSHSARQDHRYRLMYHTICLFTPQAFAGYLSTAHGGMAQAE